MNINELKELVKHCVYIEKGIACMSDTYYNDIFQTIENLKFKIDKINQYLEEYFIFDDKNGEYYQTHTFDKDNAKELHDILKEEKPKETKELFEGTMDQLNDLSIFKEDK